jgi:TonB family protein
MTSIFLERVKLRLVALTVAIGVSAYPGLGAAGLARGTQQDTRPSMTIPVQVENDPRHPVVFTEAQAGVSEPYDMSVRLPFPVAKPSMKKRVVWFTLKLKNQGDRPVNALKFMIQSPLFGHSSVGLQGKETSLMGNEEVSITFGSSVDDREDVLDLVRNMLIKPLEVSYDSEASLYDTYVSQSLNGGIQNLNSEGRQINLVAFHKLNKLKPNEDGGTNRLRLIRAEPPKHSPHADRMMDTLESVYEMNEALKPTILYKEKAEYTPEARANKVRGTVVLNVIFGADGSIRVLRVVHGLRHGLTGQALKAAQKVRFEPAVKDGKPVDVRGDLEFSFDLDQ